MKTYKLENISKGTVVLRYKAATLELKPNASTIVTENVIVLFKDQISKLSKENKVLKLSENLIEEKKEAKTTPITKPVKQTKENKEDKKDETLKSEEEITHKAE